MGNKTFYGSLSRLCVTIISIMLAFYGIFIITLGQQNKENKLEIILSLNQLDDLIKSFSSIVEPKNDPTWSWIKEQDRISNEYMIMNKEKWINSPIEILLPICDDIIEEYNKSKKEDKRIEEWLSSLNRTTFSANYILVNMLLHYLVNDIFNEFPPPTGYFINSNYPDCERDFLDWADRYTQYHQGIQEVYSNIDFVIKGMSTVYLDSAHSSAQTIEFLMEDNQTWGWHIEKYQYSIMDDVEMLNYHQTVFSSLNNIYDKMNYIKERIGDYHRFFELSFQKIKIPIMTMILSGIVVPMTILALDDRIDKYIEENNSKYMNKIIWVITIISIIIFVLYTNIGISIIQELISALYF